MIDGIQAVYAALDALRDILDNPPTQLSESELRVIRSRRIAEVTRLVSLLPTKIDPPTTRGAQ